MAAKKKATAIPPNPPSARAAADVATGRHAPKPPVADSFPLTSIMSRADMNRVNEIMQEDSQFSTEIDALTEARKEMKSELVEICSRYDIPGVRWGPFTAYVRGMKTRRTFSAKLAKPLMVENGIGLDEIEACYTESAPFPDVRIVDSSKPKKAGSEEEE